MLTNIQQDYELEVGCSCKNTLTVHKGRCDSTIANGVTEYTSGASAPITISPPTPADGAICQIDWIKFNG